MKRLVILAAVLLAGCSSFKLGGVVYCPHGMACSFQQMPPTQVTPAASGVPA